MIYVIWNDPYKGLDKDGNEYTVNVELKATAQDCIAMSRLLHPEEKDERKLLEEFMVVHCAYFRGE